MAWSRKSAMFAALAIALYLLGLVLRNQQLVTVAVVLLSFLTYAAFRTTHADVASSGRRLEDAEADAGIQLQSIVAMRNSHQREFSKTAKSTLFSESRTDQISPRFWK